MLDMEKTNVCVQTDFVLENGRAMNAAADDKVDKENSTNSAKTFSFETCKQPCIQELLEAVLTFENEIRYRDCLAKALMTNNKSVVEGTILMGQELDFLESNCCITAEDRFYLKDEKIGPMKQVRRLVSMMLSRDYRSLLLLLQCLQAANKHIVTKVLTTFSRLRHEGFHAIPKCAKCHLEDRVDLELFIDDLLASDSLWEPLYRNVANCNKGSQKSAWMDFFETVRIHNLQEKVCEILLRNLIEYCFHSDIARMIENNRQMQRNSFECLCREMQHSITIYGRNQSPREVHADWSLRKVTTDGPFYNVLAVNTETQLKSTTEKDSKLHQESEKLNANMKLAASEPPFHFKSIGHAPNTSAKTIKMKENNAPVMKSNNINDTRDPEKWKEVQILKFTKLPIDSKEASHDLCLLHKSDGSVSNKGSNEGEEQRMASLKEPLSLELNLDSGFYEDEMGIRSLFEDETEVKQRFVAECCMQEKPSAAEEESENNDKILKSAIREKSTKDDEEKGSRKTTSPILSKRAILDIETRQKKEKIKICERVLELDAFTLDSFTS